MSIPSFQLAPKLIASYSSREAMVSSYAKGTHPSFDLSMKLEAPSQI
jgi:hypothetical protein